MLGEFYKRKFIWCYNTVGVDKIFGIPSWKQWFEPMLSKRFQSIIEKGSLSFRSNNSTNLLTYCSSYRRAPKKTKVKIIK